ncbi:uncharacterized protein [Dysidea avara]|uniref:uncharacterized protein isoform X2 n=1 Tax=Dysidea avara TaxID=196820 RepID=UPI00331ACBE1
MTGSFCVIVLVFTAVTSGSALIKKVEDDFYKELGMTAEYPAESCREIYNKNPVGRNQSGYYWIKSYETTMKVYCDMHMICGCIQGGWMKIADVHDGENCPPTWKNLTIPGTSIKACRSGEDAGGVYSATYSTKGACEGFQHFCGKVIGYQKGTVDAFYEKWVGGIQIDDGYLDGVSITYGNPRKHLWSLAMGLALDDDSGSEKLGNCPCSKYTGRSPPSFVRDHYYCDSGSSVRPTKATYLPNNPVWDGEGCSSDDSCCAQANMPYFYRHLSMPVKEDIEVRLCNNQPYSDEAVLIGTMELYVL